MNLDHHLEELEEQGFSLFTGHMDREMTCRIRDYMDHTIAEENQKQPERAKSMVPRRITHPIEDPIIAQITSDRFLVDVATRSLRARNLRLRQQMFILTLPSGKPPPSTPDGWHVDTI